MNYVQCSHWNGMAANYILLLRIQWLAFIPIVSRAHPATPHLSVLSAADIKQFFQAEMVGFFFSLSFIDRVGIRCMKVPCLGLPTLLPRIDVNHRFHTALGRTCMCPVCACACVYDCAVFFLSNDFLKIRTQFAVKMLLCIIYFFHLNLS